MLIRRKITKKDFERIIALLMAIVMTVGIAMTAIEHQPVATADYDTADFYDGAEGDYEPPVEDELPPVAPAEPEMLPIMPPVGVVPPYEPEQPSVPQDGEDDLDLPEDGYIGIAPVNLIADAWISLQIMNPITGTYNPPPTAWVETDFDNWPTMIPDFASIAALPHFDNIDWTYWRVATWTLGAAVSPGPGQPDTHAVTQETIRTGPILYTFPQYVYENFYRLNWGANAIFRAYLEPIPLVDIPVEKAWECDCEEEHEPVEVHLLRRLAGQDESYNVLHDVRFLSPYDNWEHAFINLPQYYTTMRPLYSHRIIWTVYEANPPSGYEPEVVPNDPGNQEEGYRIINRPMRAPPPELSIEKQVRNHGAPESDNTDSVVANVGGTVTYTIRVDNTGGSAATNFQIIDNLLNTVGPNISNARNLVVNFGPDDTFGSASREVINGNVLEVDVLRLEAGGYILITFDATVMNVDGTRGNAHTNTAILRQPGEDDKTCTATVQVPRLTIEKTVNGQDRYYGTLASNEINYLITVRNVSPYPARDFRVVDYMNPIVYYNGSGYIVLPAASAIEVELNGTALAPSEFTLYLTPFGALTVYLLEVPVGGVVTIMIPATLHPNVAGAMSGQEFDNTARLYNPYPILEGYCDAEVILPDLRAPAVRISKTATPEYGNVRADAGEVERGDHIVYSIEVENFGNAPAIAVVVEDEIPAHLTINEMGIRGRFGDDGPLLTIAQLGAQGVVVTVEGQLVTWTIGTLAADATFTLHIPTTVDLNTPNGTYFRNQAFITEVDGEPTDYENYENYRSEIIYHEVDDVNPALDIVKRVNGQESIIANVGERITYTIVVINNGNAPANNVRVVDNLNHLIGTYLTNVQLISVVPSAGNSIGQSGISAGNVLTVDIPLLLPSGTVTITFDATVLFETAGENFTNTAYLQQREYDYYGDYTYENYRDSSSTVQVPSMLLTKVVNNVNEYNVTEPNADLLYRIAVTNTSPYPATGFRVVDDLSHLTTTYIYDITNADVSIEAPHTGTISVVNNVVTVVLGTVEPGATAYILIDAELRAMLPFNGQSFDNTARLYTPSSDTYPDGRFVNDDDAIVNIPRPTLTIEKQVNGEDYYEAEFGGNRELEFVIRVENTSNYPARGWSVVDDLGGWLGNFIEDVTLGDVSIKTSLGVEYDSPPTLDGNVLRVNFGLIPAGGNAEITIEAMLREDLEMMGQEFTNTATLYDPDDEPEDDCTVTIYLPGTPVFTIEKLVNGVDRYVVTADTASNALVYTIRVTNISEDYSGTGFRVVDDLSRLIGTYLANFTVDNVSVNAPYTSMNLSGGVLTVVLGTVEPGESVTITITVNLYGDLELEGQEFDNRAILRTPATTENPDGSPVDYDDAEVVLPDVRAPHLEIEKKVNGYDEIYSFVGERITYTIEVTNTGDATAYNFRIIDNLSHIIGTYVENAALISVTGGNIYSSELNADTNTLTVIVRSLAVGGTIRITIDATIVENAMNEYFTNIARLYEREYDDETGEYTYEETGRDDATVRVPELRIEKLVNGVDTYNGDEDSNAINYTITVRNISPFSAYGFQVIDDLSQFVANSYITLPPASAITVEGIVPAGAYEVNLTPAGILTVNLTGAVAPYPGYVTITVPAVLSPQLEMTGQTWTNTARLYSPPTGANNERFPVDDDDATVNLPDLRDSDLRIEKFVNGQSSIAANVGETVRYTIIVHNNGDAVAENFRIQDDLNHLIGSHLTNLHGLTFAFSPAGSGVVTSSGINGNILTVDVARLDIDGTITIAFYAQVTSSAAGRYDFVNVARLLEREYDDDTGEYTYVETDYDDAEVRVPELTIEKLVNNEDIYDAETDSYSIEYTIIVRNDSPFPAYGFKVVDDYLAQLYYAGYITLPDESDITVTGDITGFTLYLSDEGILMVELGLIPDGGEVTITIPARLRNGLLMAGQTFDNTVRLYKPQIGDYYRTLADYCYAIVTLPETRPPWLELDKHADRAWTNVGEVITYTVTVRNTGHVTAYYFYMEDDMSHLIGTYLYDLRNVTATATPGSAVGTVQIINNTTVRVEILELQVGGIVTITFQATVYDYAVGQTFTNVARLVDEYGYTMYNTEWRYDGDGNYGWGQERCEDGYYVYLYDYATKQVPDNDVPPVPNPVLTIRKLVNNVPLYTMEYADDVLRYTIAVTNVSQYPATGFVVRDDLSRLINTYLANFTMANVTLPSGATGTLNDGVLTVTLGTVAPGETVTIVINARLYAGLELDRQVFNNTATLHNNEGTQVGSSVATVVVPDEDGEERPTPRPPTRPGPPKRLPQTGIENNSNLWMILMVTSILFAAGIFIVLKRDERDKIFRDIGKRK